MGRELTAEAAESLGALDKFGTVEVGKRADVVLVDGNPLADIWEVRKISGVALRGRWLSRQALDTLLRQMQRD